MQAFILALLALFLPSVAAYDLWKRDKEDKDALCSIVHYCPEGAGRWALGLVTAQSTTFKTAPYSLSCTYYTVCDRTTTTSGLPTICSESTTSSSCSETTSSSSTCTETTSSTTPSSACTESSSTKTTTCSESASSVSTTWTTHSHTHYYNTTSCTETPPTSHHPIPTPPPVEASSETCKTTTASLKYTTTQPYVLTEHV